MTITDIARQQNASTDARGLRRRIVLAELLGVRQEQIHLTAPLRGGASITATVHDVTVHQMLAFAKSHCLADDLALSIRDGRFRAAGTGIDIHTDSDGNAEIAVSPALVHLPATA